MLCNNLPSGLSPSRCVVPVWGILLPYATCLNELTLAQGLERALPQALPCPCCCHQPGGQAVFAGTNRGGHGAPHPQSPGVPREGCRRRVGGTAPAPARVGAAPRGSGAVLPTGSPPPRLFSRPLAPLLSWERRQGEQPRAGSARGAPGATRG